MSEETVEFIIEVLQDEMGILNQMLKESKEENKEWTVHRIRQTDKALREIGKHYYGINEEDFTE